MERIEVDGPIQLLGPLFVFVFVFVFGGRPVIASQTRFIDRRWYVWAFNFQQSARLALPEEARSMRLLKTDLKIVQFIVRGRAHGPYPFQR
jgi:hypothetical protein